MKYIKKNTEENVSINKVYGELPLSKQGPTASQSCRDSVL